MGLHESAEMYLESIYILTLKSKSVRSIDVAEFMGYSKPSVSRAVNLLKQGDYLKVENDGCLILTDKGLKTAKCVFERHKILTEFLIKIGVDSKIADNDACKIEHVISHDTINAIKKFIKNNPPK